MTDNEQIIAIAEACDWASCYEDAFEDGLIVPTGYPPPDITTRTPLPDYLHDLNAIHEAEKTLTDKQMSKFDRHLAEICDTYEWNATASQRAEAFLRTKGLWRDE